MVEDGIMLAVPAINAASKDAPLPDMIRIPGGTFRMGSDRHYAEEAPVHRVTVDEFWVDRTPVTNRQFKAFVRATGHVTLAEIVPNAEDYPGALPHMLFAGSTVFSPPGHVVDLRDWTQWWQFKRARTGAIPLRVYFQRDVLKVRIQKVRIRSSQLFWTGRRGRSKAQRSSQARRNNRTACPIPACF